MHATLEILISFLDMCARVSSFKIPYDFDFSHILSI